MADTVVKIEKRPFIVRQVGTTGALTGFFNQEDADASAAEKNDRAQDMGLKAKYEAVANPDAA